MSDINDGRENVEYRVCQMIPRKAAVVPEELRSETRLLHDLLLYGDDAGELLCEIQDAFTVDFSKLDFERYFFSEIAPIWLLPKSLRERALAKKEPLTVGSLVACAKAGRWQGHP